MTYEEIKESIRYLDDDALRMAAKKAASDMEIASHEERNSEWHEACFATTYLYA